MTLKQIKQHCIQFSECYEGCMFYIKGSKPAKCLLDRKPTYWCLDKIEQALEEKNGKKET